jgi:DNA-binding IclR family transcriptional regulator
MFFSPELEQLDPALLAFVKCHVSSPVKWEVLRVLASYDDAWVGASELAHRTHRQPGELNQAIAELAADGVVEQAGSGDGASYRLMADEPTSVVLHRLIDAATHSLELRAIIAAHLQQVKQRGRPIRTSAAA